MVELAGGRSVINKAILSTFFLNRYKKITSFNYTCKSYTIFFSVFKFSSASFDSGNVIFDRPGVAGAVLQIATSLIK